MKSLGEECKLKAECKQEEREICDYGNLKMELIEPVVEIMGMRMQEERFRGVRPEVTAPVQGAYNIYV